MVVDKRREEKRREEKRREEKCIFDVTWVARQPLMVVHQTEQSRQLVTYRLCLDCSVW
jgi:hypothetical protein